MEEQGRRISRRRLLRLAAYSVPAMQLMNVAAASRALANSHQAPPACSSYAWTIQDYDSGMPYWPPLIMRSCGDNIRLSAQQWDPNQCVWFASWDNQAPAVQIVPCGQSTPPWNYIPVIPMSAFCYRWVVCDSGGVPGYQPVMC